MGTDLFPVVIHHVCFTSSLLTVVSFSGLGFLALFAAGRLNVLDTRGQVWKTIVALVPLVAAGFIAVSRLMDNRYTLFKSFLISDIIHLTLFSDLY